MALYMSEKQKHVCVRSEKTLFSPASGEAMGKERRVYAGFRKGGVPVWAMALADERFVCSGKPPDIPKHMFISTYDSVLDQAHHKWTDEERKLIEDTLDSLHDVVRIEKPKAALPYNKYPEHRKIHGRRTLEVALRDVVAAIEATGVEPETVVAYERDHPDELSEKIIAAMEKVAEADPAEEEEVVAA